jgi:hypothetical protein
LILILILILERIELIFRLRTMVYGNLLVHKNLSCHDAAER